MAVTFLKFKKELSDEDFKEARKLSIELRRKRSEAVLMAMNGMGLGFNRVLITFHKNYSSYMKSMDDAKAYPYVDASSVQSFMVNLIDEPHFLPLTLSAIAEYY